MKESEIPFVTLAENLPGQAWVADPLCKILWFNKRWHEYTGNFQAEESEKLSKEFSKMLKNSLSFEQELQIKSSDGILRWFLIQASPVRGQKGEIVRWLGTNTNIDSYKSNQHNLEVEVVEKSKAESSSREFLNSVLENIPHMVFVKSAKDLRFVHFNKAGEDLLGYKRSELLGKNDFDFFPEAEARHFVEKDQAVLNSGKLDIVEEVITTKSGVRILRTKKIPLLGSDKTPEYLLGISEDITEWLESQRHKQEFLEDKVRQKEREFSLERAVFLADVNSILVSSLDFRLTLADLAKKLIPFLGDWCTITITNEEDKLERVAWSHVDSGKLNLMEELKAYSSTRLSDSLNVRHVMETGIYNLSVDVKDGDLIKAAQDENHLRIMRNLGLKSCLIVPIIYHGKIYGAITLIYARSKKHDAEGVLLAEEVGRKAGVAIENAYLYQTAQKAIAVRDEFLSIASHELKTPITALKLQVQMTRQSVNLEKHLMPEPAKLIKTLDSANDQINRLTSLIEDLLDVTRIESGKISYNLEPLEISSLLRDLTDLYSEHLKNAGCVLNVIKIEKAKILGDRGRIEQVILNLLSNSAKYGQGKPVSLKVETEKDFVRIELTDQGMGIAEDKLGSIFDRFVRAVSSKNISGLGLGLYISREIVKAHHGSIQVESKIGVGTTFIVRLPLLK
jgi:PAS domain S-box-containing protein